MHTYPKPQIQPHQREIKRMRRTIERAESGGGLHGAQLAITAEIQQEIGADFVGVRSEKASRIAM